MANLLDKVLSKDYELRNLYLGWRAGSLDNEAKALLAEELRDNKLTELAELVEASMEKEAAE